MARYFLCYIGRFEWISALGSVETASGAMLQARARGTSFYICGANQYVFLMIAGPSALCPWDAARLVHLPGAAAVSVLAQLSLASAAST